MKILTFIMSRVIQTAWADVVETEAHSVVMTERDANSKAHFDAAQKEATERFPPTEGWQVANVTSSHIEGDALRNLFVVISFELGVALPFGVSP